MTMSIIISKAQSIILDRIAGQRKCSGMREKIIEKNNFFFVIIVAIAVRVQMFNIDDCAGFACLSTKCFTIFFTFRLNLNESF